MNDDIKELILMRMDRLYRELPIEYCGYALSAIEDIEYLLYVGPEKKSGEENLENF